MSVTRENVVHYLQEGAGRPLKIRELGKALGVSQDDYRGFRRLIKEMERDGAVVRLRNSRYTVPRGTNLVSGRLSITSGGFGFLSPDESGPDIFIRADAKGTALNGDRVLVRVTRRGGAVTQPEGEVARVLERVTQSAVGTYRRRGSFRYVVPDDPRFPHDVFISEDDATDAKDGQTVVVSLDGWQGRNPVGRISEILGGSDDPGVDVLSVIRSHNLPLEFPEHVVNASESVPGSVSDADLQGRRDLRDLLCFTIDPADARDHDDAVSLEQTDDGWRLGVHIADVSHYASEGSPLDHEAMARGTSVYLVDRVIPMLPERLSNRICSLRPDEDRLAVSVFVDFDAEFTQLREEICTSVIRSRAKLSYEQVQSVLDGSGEGREAAPYADALLAMETLRRTLTRARIENGAIDLDLPEPKVTLDDTGHPVRITARERLASHRLIEEFMLLANHVVADYLERRGIPFLYRVHDRPDATRLAEFAQIARAFGARLPRAERLGPKDIQRFLREVEDRPAGPILNQRLLRSMKKAVYTPKNLGHFGLASECYTHFTSPIRRYPDLLTHRILKEQLAGTLDAERREQLGERLPDIGDLATAREVAAQEAEWDSVKVKQVRYLEDRIGEIFEGTIVSTRAIGFFVQLDDVLIDGLVKVGALRDDYYVYHDNTASLVGERTGRTFRLGDRLRVELVRADRRQLQIDFELAENGGSRRNPLQKRPDRSGGKPKPPRAGGRSRNGRRRR